LRKNATVNRIIIEIVNDWQYDIPKVEYKEYCLC